MTEAEARERLLRQYPVPWVGDLVEEDEGAFLFQATIHKPGEAYRSKVKEINNARICTLLRKLPSQAF